MALGNQALEAWAVLHLGGQDVANERDCPPVLLRRMVTLGGYERVTGDLMRLLADLALTLASKRTSLASPPDVRATSLSAQKTAAAGSELIKQS